MIKKVLPVMFVFVLHAIQVDAADSKVSDRLMSLRGEWSFQLDPNDIGENQKWFEKETVPWVMK